MEGLITQILSLVEQIVSYFKEVDAAAVIDMIKEFIARLGA